MRRQKSTEGRSPWVCLTKFSSPVFWPACSFRALVATGLSDFFKAVDAYNISLTGFTNSSLYTGDIDYINMPAQSPTYWILQLSGTYTVT